MFVDYATARSHIAAGTLKALGVAAATERANCPRAAGRRDNRGSPASKPPGKAQNEAQAKEKIRTITNRLESGEDFSTLATKYSEDIDTGDATAANCSQRLNHGSRKASGHARGPPQAKARAVLGRDSYC